MNDFSQFWIAYVLEGANGGQTCCVGQVAWPGGKLKPDASRRSDTVGLMKKVSLECKLLNSFTPCYHVMKVDLVLRDLLVGS